jgi:hypothetical protein
MNNEEAILIRIEDRPAEMAGKYLKTFDHEAYDGRGYGTFTDDPLQAKQFPGITAALEFWNRQSKVRPLRQDGRPNKPLTASTVSFLRFQDATASPGEAVPVVISGP